MSRAVFAAVAVVLFALSGGQALGATIQWAEDTRRGPLVWLDADPGERVDLTLRATSGTSFEPEEIVVENSAGTLTSPGTFPAPGSCDPLEVECSVPCQIETPNRARCSVYDGFSRGAPRLNPYEPPYRSFYNGPWLFLDSGDDHVTVPADNPVRFNLRSDELGGTKTWDLARVNATIQAGRGAVINSGSGANVGAGIWGPVTFNSANGSADSAHCWTSDPQTMRLDIHDDVEGCSGDIQQPPSPVGPVPQLDPENHLEDVSNEAAGARRCIESNIALPGSCTTP